MPTVSEAFQIAQQLHAGGRWEDAGRLYGMILQVDPRHDGSLHGVGLIAFQQGRGQEAAAAVRAAIGINGTVVDYHYNLGVILRSLGDVPGAAAHYARAAAIDPHRADAFRNLGRALSACGHFPQAARACRAAIAADPGMVTAYADAAALQQPAPDWAGGVRMLQRCVQLAPMEADFWGNLGIALKNTKRHEEAARVFRQTIILDPGRFAAYTGACDALVQAFRGTEGEAMTLIRRAVRLAPDRHEPAVNHGRLLEQCERFEEAIPWFRQVICLQPGESSAFYNLGMMLERLERIPEAAAAYRRARRIAPLFSEAQEKTALLLNMCDWSDYDAVADGVLSCVRSGGKVPMIPLVYLPSTPADQLACARRHAETALANTAALRDTVRFAHPRAAKDRLTIGYMSGDFREHAVAFLIAEMFELHDRGRFRIFGYSTGPDAAGQPMRQRLEAAFDRMTNIRDLPVEQAARRIHEDGVDILVDLSGYTRHCRTEVMTLRPAPIQVNYLGYPGTMGAGFIDYILTDPFSVPADQQPFYAERLVHLPDTYQANDRRRPVADTVFSRADCGLPEDGVVFCSFNHTPKFTPMMFDIWMRLLRRVPGSVLWLLKTDETAMANLGREAAARGVDPARLVFAPRMGLPLHLARYRTADLFLDTAPYNAHTTASDALWVGCPVVTFAGTTFPGRVAGSLLRAAGMPELIAPSPEAYEALALALANDAARRADLRRRLEENRDRCALFDTPRFTRNVEWAYAKMWEIFLSGAPPQAFAVPAPLP